MSGQPGEAGRPAGTPRPEIVGDVVFGGSASPVAVCTLASRSLLPGLAGRPEIAIAGRVFTENVGVERMVQNLLGLGSIRYLIVCGRETPHRVGQTIFSLHRDGLGERGRVVGSEAPEPIMPNLSPAQVRAFQSRITLVDMIGVVDAEAVAARARQLMQQALPAGDEDAQSERSEAAPAVQPIVAVPDDPAAWTYDPLGFFLVFVDRAAGRLRVEHYTQDRRLHAVIEGRNAQEICHTVVRLGLVTLLAHAAYLGRELAKAEAALTLGLDYEQDRTLRPAR